jgi:hypothetical protein
MSAGLGRVKVFHEESRSTKNLRRPGFPGACRVCVERRVINARMPRAMKTATASLLLLFALAACRSSGNAAADNADAIFKAPKASTGSGVDPETQGITSNSSEVKEPRPEVTTGIGFQFKEITVDPKDARTRIDLARTLLGEEWIFVSKTLKGAGVEVWKFMRRDAARLDVDPFGIPDIFKATKEPVKPVGK